MKLIKADKTQKTGRFAPSPTGLLHFGSLVTAVASYCFAKAAKAQWLVRMEDLDVPRNIPGAADAILRQLEHLGLCWDKTVLYQSARLEFYADTLQHLIDAGHVYRCICTRREIAAEAQRHTCAGPVYSGRCRLLQHSAEKKGSWRFVVSSDLIEFDDLIHGKTEHSLIHTVGDYILKRADNIFAYQFTTPLDDAAQGVTQVIRGADLLDSTPRQIYLLHSLHKSIPEYGHIPLALDAGGNKISKSAQVLRHIDPGHPLPFGSPDLFRALQFLGQAPPLSLQHSPPVELLTWAVNNFKPSSIPRHNQSMFPAPTY